MKKLSALALVLVMATALAVLAFTSNTSTVEPTTNPDTNSISLFTDGTYSENGEWTSPEFTATSSNGNYIRYWHQNHTAEDVKVYLYRTDSGKSVLISSMQVPQNDQNAKVYYAENAGSGTYKIVVEAYVSGGLVSGSAVVSQYKTSP